MFVNNESASYITYASFLSRGGNMFIISGDFRQSLILYTWNANGLRYLPISFVGL